MTSKERQVFEELRGACQAIIRDWEHNLSHAAQLCQSAFDAAQELDADRTTVTVRARCDGQEICLEFDREVLFVDNGALRESIRRRLRRLAMDIFAHAPSGVFFEDECPECEGPLENGRCPNVNCPSHAGQKEGV